MPPKPIDKRNVLETREAIWTAIRRLKVFTSRRLYMETRCSRETIKEYLTGLTAAGYVSALTNAAPGPLEYALARDCGIDAPRVRRDGTEITQGRSRENMWRAMKIIGDFTYRDLAVHAATEETPVAEAEARDYCYHLHRAGYLALITAGKPGSRTTAGALTLYRLLPSKYSGPKPPMVQRVKQVYDPNLKKVVWKGDANDNA